MAGKLVLETSGVMDLCQNEEGYKLLLFEMGKGFEAAEKTMVELASNSHSHKISDYVKANITSIIALINQKYPQCILQKDTVNPHVLRVVSYISKYLPKIYTVKEVSKEENLKFLVGFVQRVGTKSITNSEAAAGVFLDTDEGMTLVNLVYSTFKERTEKEGMPVEDKIIKETYIYCIRATIRKMFLEVVGCLKASIIDHKLIALRIKDALANYVKNDIEIVAMHRSQGKIDMARLRSRDSDIFFASYLANLWPALN